MALTFGALIFLLTNINFSNAIKSQTFEFVSKNFDAVRSQAVDVSENEVIKMASVRGLHRIQGGGSYNQDGDTFLRTKLEECRAGVSVMSCMKYRVLQFIHDFVTPLRNETVLSDLAHGRMYDTSQDIKFVSLPYDNSTTTSIFLPYVESRSYDTETTKVVKFLLRQLDRFLRFHGVSLSVIPGSEVTSFSNLQYPVVLEHDTPTPQVVTRESRSSQTQFRKKDTKTVLFPLLILFKFFKIKLLLYPILLGIMFIKKLLLLAAFAVPNILGLLRFCRPFILGGVGQNFDSAFEPSSQLSYAAPYHRTSNNWRNNPYKTVEDDYSAT